MDHLRRLRLVEVVAAVQVGSGSANLGDLGFQPGDPVHQLGRESLGRLGDHFGGVLPGQFLLLFGSLLDVFQQGSHGLLGEPAPARAEPLDPEVFPKLVDLGFQLLDAAVPLGLPGHLEMIPHRQAVLPPPGLGPSQAVEEGDHSVIVLLGEGIELVIVAAGTAHGQAQECLGGGPDHVIQLIEAVLVEVGRLVVPGAQPVEPHRDMSLGGGVLQLVPGQLLQNEPVVGLVLVQ